MNYKHLLGGDEMDSHRYIKKMKSEINLDLDKKIMEKERKIKRKGKQVAIQFITKAHEDDKANNGYR